MLLMVQGAHRGRPVAAAPCTPWLRPAKSPLRGAFDLSLQASGRAEAASVQNTALSPHPCGLPRPSGNVSAILRPPTPAVSARIVNNLTTGCPDRRPDKASAAIRHKYGNRVEWILPGNRGIPSPNKKDSQRLSFFTVGASQRINPRGPYSGTLRYECGFSHRWSGIPAPELPGRCSWWLAWCGSWRMPL
ncbi:Uncharacterised protein [Klebsiella variicola]|nr:Uncharacterised protein [Klebsiella variicola]